MRNEEANNVKKVASTFLTKRGKKVASTFLGPLLVFLPSFFNHLCEAFDVSPATCPTVKLGVEAGRPTGESRYPASRIPWIPAFAGKTNLLPNTGYRLLMLLWPVTCFLLPVTSHAADLFPGRGSFKSASSASAALPVKTSSIITLLTPADGATGVSQSPSLNVAGNYLAGMGVQYHFQVNTAADMTSPQGDFDQTGAQLFASSGAFSGQNATISSANDAYSAVSTATFVYYSSSSVKLSANTQYYWRARVKPSGGSYSNWSSTASFTTGQFASVSPVNHLAIGGVNLFGATDNGQMSIGFTIAENNVTTGTSTNGGAYNTADWIFVKFSTAAGADGSWNHATLTGGTVGAGATLAAASDNKGVYVNHTTNSAYWTAGATITWNAAADGIFTTPTIVKVFAVSMVKVPTGNFIYNVSNIGGSTFSNYNSGTQATITGPGTATGTGTNNLPLNAPVGWPNGYNSFYIGRYEITQGQYADFLNTIPSGLASTLHFTSVANGHNMTNTGTYPTKYAAADSNAAKNFLSFDDGWRYLSWAGLRPPTEMEFEKAGRDLSPDARIYPWGVASKLKCHGLSFLEMS